MNIGLILSVVLFAIAAISVALGILKGYRKPLIKTVAKTVSVILSAIVSIIAAKTVAAKLGGILYTEFGNEIFTDELATLPEAIPSLEGIAVALIGILTAPILFIILLIIFRVIFAIISAIVLSIITAKRKSAPKSSSDGKGANENISEAEETEDNTSETDSESSAKSGEEESSPKGLSDGCKRGIGMALGAVCALIVFVVSWAPITGFLALTGEISLNLPSEGEDDIPEIEPYIEAISNNAAVKFTNGLGGNLVFNTLTTSKVGDVKVKLAKETGSLGAVISAITLITDEEAESSVQANALRDLSSAFESSSLLPIVASEFLSGAADAFSRGEEFLGISMDSDEGAMNELLVSAVASFKNSTLETVKEDVHTIIEVAALLIEKGVAGEDGETDVSALLSDTEFMKSLLLEMLGNTHMSSIVHDGINVFIKMFVTDALGAHASADELYPLLLDELAGLDCPEDELSGAVKKAFDKYGITISDKSANDLASELSPIVFGNADAAAVQEVLDSIKLTIVLPNKTEKTAYINNAATLADFTVIKTAEDLTTESKPITNPEAEVDILVETIATLPELSGALEGDTSDISSFMKSIGRILDKFSATELIGKECTDMLVILIFQSDAISDVIPISRVSITSAAESIIRGSENKSYEQVMSDLSKTLEALLKLSQSENLKDDDSIKNLLDTITTESAEVIEHMIDSELVSELGVSEKSAESLSNMVTSTLNKLAEAKENESFDEEQYNKEIESITYLINTAIDVSREDGENIEINVSDYVDTILDSEIVTSVILESVYDENGNATVNPLDIEFEPTEEEKTELADALTDKLNSVSEEERAQMEKTITAIAGLINVEVIITGGGVMLP